jgi:hypothetical protein
MDAMLSTCSAPNRLMADVDSASAFVQRVLNIAKRKRKPNVQHHSQPNDLVARLEVVEGAVFCHPTMLITRTARLNRFCSDSADPMNTRRQINLTTRIH